MWRFGTAAVLAMALAGVPGAHAAAPPDPDEATITVVDDGDTPDDIVKVIELPSRAVAPGNGKSASGATNANAAGSAAGAGGREFGQQTAEEARSRNDQVREEARQQGRSEARGDNAGDNRGKSPH